VRKGSHTTFNIVKIGKICEKNGKIRKTWSMTKKKKKVIRNFCRENGNFFRKNRHSEILVRPPKLDARSPPLVYLPASVATQKQCPIVKASFYNHLENVLFKRAGVGSTSKSFS